MDRPELQYNVQGIQSESALNIYGLLEIRPLDSFIGVKRFILDVDDKETIILQSRLLNLDHSSAATAARATELSYDKETTTLASLLI